MQLLIRLPVYATSNKVARFCYIGTPRTRTCYVELPISAVLCAGGGRRRVKMQSRCLLALKGGREGWDGMGW